LGLSLQTQILFSDSASDGTAPASDVEASVTPSDIEKVVDQALSIAPEQAQIYELVQAGQDGTWSKAFGWINSASISSSGTSGSSASLSNLHPKGSITLGLGIYPAIELSNRNVEEIRQRLIELKQENTQILEGSILAVKEAQKEFAHFATAESNLQDVYNDTLQRYQMGIASLYDVLIAHKALTSAAINRIQAQLDVTLLRVTLHRTMLTDQFAQIRGCDSANLPKQEKRGGLAGWFDGIFGGNHDDNGVSLMQLCKQTD
jgi:outer membrane protein TolC